MKRKYICTLPFDILNIQRNLYSTHFYQIYQMWSEKMCYSLCQEKHPPTPHPTIGHAFRDHESTVEEWGKMVQHKLQV